MCVLGTIESERTTMGVECGQETGAEAVNPPGENPELTKHIEEAKKKMQELREKTGQWSRRFTQVHALTMHTAASRKDNDTPAAVTSLHISRYTYLIYNNIERLCTKIVYACRVVAHIHMLVSACIHPSKEAIVRGCTL